MDSGILSDTKIIKVREFQSKYEELVDLGREADEKEFKDKMLEMLEKKSTDNNRYRQNARKSVRKAIVVAIDKIRENDDIFADHLTHNVKTGFDCIYNPLEKNGWLT